MKSKDNESNNSRKGNQILLTVIAVATLLVAIIGVSFAYFTASVSGNDTASSVIVNTANIGTITYTNGNEIRLENAYPGAYSNTVTFTVASSGAATTTTQYVLYWTNVSNTFSVKSDLEYTLTGTGTGAIATRPLTTTAPSAEGAIAGTATLTGGSSHSYTLQVHFKETGSDQNSNQGKSFAGKIEVKTSDTGDVYYTDSARSGQTTVPDAY